MSFRIDPNPLNNNLPKIATKASVVLLMYAATKAVELQYKMQQNRPWTDRTGKAKATLNAKVSQPSATTVRITLAHGVDYGIWLELAHEKKYAIIEPTIRLESPRVVEDMAQLMDKMKP